MNLLLDLWCAIMFGILYLTFQAFPVIFIGHHGFTIQQTGMSFLGIGIGMIFGMILNIYLIMYVFSPSESMSSSNYFTRRL